MAFKNFAKNLYTIVHDGLSVTGLCKITSPSEFTLSTARLAIYVQDVASAVGSETMQVKLYSDAEHTKVYSSSEIVNLSDVVSGSNWIGLVGFDFTESPNINSQPVYAGLVTTSYTKSEPFYISCIFDWPLFVNDSTEPTKRGAWIELYGKQNLNDISR